MTKKIWFLISVVIVILLLVSCGTDSGSDADSDNLEVTFQVDSARLLSRAEDISPAEVVYVDITKTYPEYIHQSLVDGVNNVELPKGGVYVMALVGRDETAESAVASRSLSGAISLLGNFSIVSNGLDTLPVNDTGGNSLDLGTVTATADSDTYESEADSSQVEDALGYSGEELDSYSIFDKSLLKVMNPDINRNGVYDDEEDLKWRLSGMRTYAPYQASDVDLSNDVINVSLDRFTSDTDFNLVFWHNESFPHPDVENVWLTLPEGNTYTDYDGETITGVHPEYGSSNDDGTEFQYYFPFNRDIASPEAPYSGDYVLDLDGQVYYFDNVNYMSADDYGSGGFLVPFVEVAFDQDDLLTTLTWKWYKIEGNGYVPANSEEVHLQILEFYFYLPDDSRVLGPRNWGLNYYDNGTVDISSLGIHKSEMDGGNTLHYDYWDRAENDNGFILTVE